MKREIITLIALFVLRLAISAHYQIPKDISTPNACGLGHYGDVPVSYYTGKAEITIPLYEFEIRGVRFPITLSYDASGLLMNNLPGWTGHNWVLNAGGCITRVRGGASCDETDHSYEENGSMFLNYFTYHNVAIDYYNDYQDASFGEKSNFVITTDMSPDVFYFNMLGISGRFFLGNDGQWKVFSDANIEVVYNYRDRTNGLLSPVFPTFPDGTVSQPKTIKEFILRDERGVKYFFGGSTDNIEYSMPFFRQCNNEVNYPWIANSWYLYKIEDRYGNELYRLNYTRGRFIAQFFNQKQLITEAFLNEPGSSFPVNMDYYEDYEVFYNNVFPYNAVLNSPVYLTSISIMDGREVLFGSSDAGISMHTAYEGLYSQYEYNANYLYYAMCSFIPNFNGATIRFYYLDPRITAMRQYQRFHENDLDILESTSLRKLNDISVRGIPMASPYEQQGSAPSYTFVYDYNGRMHLAELRRTSLNTEPQRYRFVYNHFEKIPGDYLTRKTDHWGYYNGNEDPISIYNYATFGQTRIPNEDSLKLGLLTSIIYPTGGRSDFEYEAHRYGQYLSEDRQSLIAASGIAGGVRIKSIKEYNDSVSTTPMKTRFFSYLNPNSTLSSGVLFAQPRYYWANWHPKASREYVSVSFFRTSSIIPLSNSFGPHIGYSYVEEERNDGAVTLYHYKNISDSDARDIPFEYQESVTSPTPYDQFSERGYKRGRILSETVYLGTDTLQKTEYTYRSDNVEDKYVLVGNIEPHHYGLSGVVMFSGGIYKLFYPHYDIIEKKQTIFFEGGNLVNTISYLRKDTTISISRNGYPWETDVRQLISETDSTIGGWRKTAYQYPYQFNDSRAGLLQQFCLLPVQTTNFQNGIRQTRHETLFRSVAGKLLPDCELEWKYGQNTPDTIVRYVDYTNTGALAQYQERGLQETFLNWTGNDNHILSKCIGGQETLYEYDSMFQIISITNPNGLTTSYQYDSMGRLSSIKDHNRNVTMSFEYNNAN